MHDFAVRIGRVSAVEPHPERDKLDLVSISGYTNVANRPEAGVPRYKVGDYAVVLTENLILPDVLIKHLDMWDEAKNKGGLAGGKGNRTKARKVGGIVSEVALCKINHFTIDNFTTITIEGHGFSVCKTIDNCVDPEGVDMAECLNITEYVKV